MSRFNSELKYNRLIWNFLLYSSLEGRHHEPSARAGAEPERVQLGPLWLRIQRPIVDVLPRQGNRRLLGRCRQCFGLPHPWRPVRAPWRLLHRDRVQQSQPAGHIRQDGHPMDPTVVGESRRCARRWTRIQQRQRTLYWTGLADHSDAAAAGGHCPAHRSARLLGPEPGAVVLAAPVNLYSTPMLSMFR